MREEKEIENENGREKGLSESESMAPLRKGTSGRGADGITVVGEATTLKGRAEGYGREEWGGGSRRGREGRMGMEVAEEGRRDGKEGSRRW